MNDINSIILIGRLTKDTELKYTSGGMAIAKGAIAVNRSVKAGEGYKDQASFFDFSIFGKTAENLKSYLTKGKQVALIGYLKQERWTDSEGIKRTKVEICVNEIELLGSREKKGNPEGADYEGSAFPEDIPF